jgi:hypothetical protein
LPKQSMLDEAGYRLAILAPPSIDMVVAFK